MKEEVAPEVPRLSCWPDMAVIWTFALALPTAVSILYLMRGRTRFVLTDRRLLETVVIELAGLAATAAYLKSRDRFRGSFSIRPSWIGTGLGLGLLITVWFLYTVCARLMLAWGGDPHLFTHVHVVTHASLPAILAACVVNPLFEELIVVGCVVSALERRGAIVAIVVSAGFRLTYHLYQGPVAFASILPTGLLFAAYYWKKRDLWPLMVAHAALDLVPMLLVR